MSEDNKLQKNNIAGFIILGLLIFAGLVVSSPNINMLNVQLWDNINYSNNANVNKSIPVTLISNTNTTLLKTQPDPLLFRLGRGAINNSGPIFIVGDNPDVGNSLETIWNVDGLYPWLLNESFLNITSDDSDDSISGTGARQILLIGLDINYNEIIDVVSTNGTTTSTSNIKFFRLNDAVVLSAGTTRHAEGTIDITSNQDIILRDGDILGRIEGEKNRIQQIIYTVPINKTLFTGNFFMSAGKDDQVQVQAWARTGKDGLFYISSVSYAYEDTIDYTNFNIFGIPATTDIEVRGINAAISGSSKVAGVVEFSLFDNTELDKFNVDFPLNR